MPWNEIDYITMFGYLFKYCNNDSERKVVCCTNDFVNDVFCDVIKFNSRLKIRKKKKILKKNTLIGLQLNIYKENLILTGKVLHEN